MFIIKLILLIIESKEENARAKEIAIIKLGEIYSEQKLVFHMYNNHNLTN